MSTGDLNQGALLRSLKVYALLYVKEMNRDHISR